MDENVIVDTIIKKFLKWRKYSKNMYMTNNGIFCGSFNPFSNAGDLKKVLGILQRRRYLITIQLNVFNMWTCEIDNGKQTSLTTEDEYEKAILYSVYKLIK